MPKSAYPDITARHPQYRFRADDWRRCRDTFEGEQAVKARGVAYVPICEGMPPTPESLEYQAYIMRGTFYPAMERTVIGLSGMVLRKPAQVVAPESVDHEAGITLHGEGLSEFTAAALEQILVTGRAGIALDWSEAENRPYWTLWSAESIVNWRARVENGEIIVDLVVLEEEYDRPVPGDPYATVRACNYRELNLATMSTTGQPIAVQRVWTQTKANDKTSYTPGPWTAYMRRGQAINRLPFVFCGTKRPTADVSKPPLLDLASLNLSHWRSSVDYEHGLHFTALPTPYITGHVPSNPLRIGSGVAWAIPHAEARVGMLEYTGQGLKGIEAALDRKEKQMATVGARLLEKEPTRQETAEAVRLRHAGEGASLSVISRSLSMSLTMALRFHAWWQGFDVEAQPDDKISVQLNTDYLESALTAQELDALVKAWQAGGISGKTFYYNLQQGEIARPNVTWEEEQEDIKADEPPPVAPATPLPGQPTPPGVM